jgi:hypothetical protein
MLMFANQREAYRPAHLSIFLAARFFLEVAALVQAVAIGWTIYRLSNAPLALGLVGLVEFIPMALLMLPAGEPCDRAHRTGFVAQRAGRRRLPDRSLSGASSA